MSQHTVENLIEDTVYLIDEAELLSITELS